MKDDLSSQRVCGKLSILRDSLPESLPTPRRATVSTMNMVNSSRMGGMDVSSNMDGVNSKSTGIVSRMTSSLPTSIPSQSSINNYSGMIATTSTSTSTSTSTQVVHSGNDGENISEEVKGNPSQILTNSNAGHLVLPSSRFEKESQSRGPNLFTYPGYKSSIFGRFWDSSQRGSTLFSSAMGETQLTLRQKLGGRHFGEVYLYTLESTANTLDVLFIGDVVSNDDQW